MNRFTITPAGIALAAGTTILYVTGVLFGYPILVMIAVGGLGMLLAGLAAVAMHPAVTLSRRISPQRLTVGTEAVGHITITNSSRWPAPAFTAVDRIGERSVELAVSALAPGQHREVTYPVPGYRRGRLRLGPLTVERRDPLGLFVWAQRQVADGVLWVHPKVHPLPVLPVGVVLDYEDRTSDNARLGTMTFSALREYVAGDDPRHIHWRSTARLGTLVVREHVDTTEPSTTVVLDTRIGDPVSFDRVSFEDAIEMAASVVRAVEDLGRPAALHILDERPDRSAGAVSALDRLALAEPTCELPGATALLTAINRIPAGGALVVVTGVPEPSLMGRIAEQRRRFAPVVVASIGPGSAPAGTRRRPGLALLTGATAAEVAGAWRRMVGGNAE